MAAAVAATVPSGREADAYGRCLGASIARNFSMDIVLDETQHMELMPIPGSFICPISNDVMDDPVATVDGNIYERMYIKRWFQERRQLGLPITSPATGLELTSTFVLPVVALKRAIETYIQHRPELKRTTAILQHELLEKQAVHASVADELNRLRLRNSQLEAENEQLQCQLVSLQASPSVGHEQVSQQRYQPKQDHQQDSQRDDLEQQAPSSCSAVAAPSTTERSQQSNSAGQHTRVAASDQAQEAHEECQPAAAAAPAAPAAPAPNWPSKAEGYELTTKIRHGTFAEVRKAVIKEGAKKGAEVAVKIIEFEEFVESSLEEIRRELQWMRMCRHENVIAYHVAFPAKRQMWLVMPLLAGGSCANVMRSRQAMGGFDDLSIVAYILRETAKAVKYFHDNQQIHSDLKAGNILLSGDAKVFLSDFGVAAYLRDDLKRRNCVRKPCCWTAPEVLEHSSGYDYKTDIWSFGITAIELAYGEAPYQQLPPLKIMVNIIENDPPRIDKRKWDALFVALIECCLQKDPRKRATMEDIFAKHKKFFAKANEQPLVDILSSLPPLEQRINFRNASWDFRTDDHDDVEDPLGHLGEDES